MHRAGCIADPVRRRRRGRSQESHSYACARASRQHQVSSSRSPGTLGKKSRDTTGTISHTWSPSERWKLPRAASVIASNPSQRSPKMRRGLARGEQMLEQEHEQPVARLAHLLDELAFLPDLANGAARRALERERRQPHRRDLERLIPGAREILRIGPRAQATGRARREARLATRVADRPRLRQHDQKVRCRSAIDP